MSANGEKSLELGLLLLRLTMGAFFLVWSFDKIANPAHSLSVFESFYKVPVTQGVALGLGVAQALIVAAFVAGLYRKWTTLVLLAMHTVSVGSTWAHLIDPYGEQSFGLVFWAGVPVWAGLLLLWLARGHDRMWSLAKD